MFKKIIFFVLFMTLIFPQLFAHELDSNTKALLKMSIEELLNVKITTAGKKEEKISDIPASVVLITHEEIKKYGYRNLQEILESQKNMLLTRFLMKKRM